MSNLLSLSEFNKLYNPLSEGDFCERLSHYYQDIDLTHLNSYKDLKIDDEEVAKFVRNINEIIKNKSKVLVVSDYDCDGVCSLSILLRLLKYLNINHNYLIPSRTKEGYGLNIRHVDIAKEYKFDYIIALDSGVRAKEAIDYAKALGIKIIIIDHHEFEDRPGTEVFIHPDILDDYYKDACTGALVYLLSKLYYEDAYSLVLAMIASIGDVVPVIKANRQIINEGLKLFNDEVNLALNIKLLINNAKEVTSEDIAFKVVPKINAISRLDPLYNVNKYIPYFRDALFDENKAKEINDINEKRKEISIKMVNDALSRIHDEDFIILESENYYEGLCGVVAGRIAEEFKRPCLILAKGESYKGSARSYGNFDLYGLLNEYKEYFESFGGHKKAVGLSMKEEGLMVLKGALRNFKFNEDVDRENIIVIHEDDLTLENIDYLASLEPFGETLKKPLFYLECSSYKSKFLVKSLYPKYTLNSGHEVFGFDKSLYLDEFRGFIGTISKNKMAKNKITLSLNKIVL